MNWEKGENLGRLVRRLVHRISPPPPVGGLQITDSMIRFSQFKDGEVRSLGWRLPPGILEKGEVKEANKLLLAFEEIHRRLTPLKTKEINVILTVSPAEVYLQPIILPAVAAENLDEAAKLNLQMASPLNLAEAYYDWQVISGGESFAQPVEILGAFLPRRLSDRLVALLGEAHFQVAALEFSSLSLARDLRRQQLIEAGRPYLVIAIEAEGLTFLVLRNGGLVFHYFLAWRDLPGGGEEIKWPDFEAALSREIKTLFNFYASRWPEQINEVIVVTNIFQSEIESLISQQWPQIKTAVYGSERVNAAAGAAYRGWLFRSEDQEINLLGEESSALFSRIQVLNFISIWRNIILATSVVLLLIFLGADIFLRQSAEQVSRTSLTVLSQSTNTELETLKNRANEFNRLVAWLGAARPREAVFWPVIETINNLAGAKITLSRFYLPSSGEPATINGTAASEEELIAFKNRIAAQPQFGSIQLPLSGLSQGAAGEISFTLQFHINNFKF
jgi:hypothetical protein